MSGRPGLGADRAVDVVRAKLREPRDRPWWVRRRALLRSLRHQRARLVLIDAPAGYGKSTLIAQWKMSESRPFAWVSLDATDNDPINFWSYVVEAIAEALPSVAEGLEDHIRTQGSVRDRLIPRLLNRLNEAEAELVLVLDDYHLIRQPVCHELVGFLLDNLPEQCQLVLITRVDPPLNIAKLRVEDQLVDLRAEHLRFRPREAEELLKNVLGWTPPISSVKDLWARTEGWPAALYLAALSLGDQADVEAFVDGFTGDNRMLAEYLTDEVLGRQTPEVRRFLTRTSILEHFTPDLAAEVVGEEDDPDVLLELERANLFVLPMDEKREWYRYHPLFRQLLLSDLERAEFDAIPELHRRAVGWHMRHGYVDGAVEHAISSGDATLVRDLIWGNFLAYMNAGRFKTLDRWLHALGPAKVASDPILSLASGWLAGANGRSDETADWLEVAARAPGETPMPDGAGTVGTGVALLRAMYGPDGVSESLASARKAFAATDPMDPWRAIAHFCLGYLLHVSGSHDEAMEQLEEARSLSHHVQPSVEAASLSELSLLAGEVGDAATAGRRAEEALRVATEASLLELPVASFVHTAHGRVVAEEGDLVAGLEELERALTLCEEHFDGGPWATLQIMIALAPVRFATGDHEGARDLVSRARTLLNDHPDSGDIEGRVKQLERTLGRASQRPAVFGERLTDREVAVLQLLATDLTHREIGAALFISLNTVKSHVRSLYQKLMASSRAEAVEKGRELEMI